MGLWFDLRRYERLGMGDEEHNLYLVDFINHHMDCLGPNHETKVLIDFLDSVR
jgi:hypothetical protein